MFLKRGLLVVLFIILFSLSVNALTTDCNIPGCTCIYAYGAGSIGKFFSTDTMDNVYIPFTQTVSVVNEDHSWGDPWELKVYPLDNNSDYVNYHANGAGTNVPIVDNSCSGEGVLCVEQVNPETKWNITLEPGYYGFWNTGGSYSNLDGTELKYCDEVDASEQGCYELFCPNSHDCWNEEFSGNMKCCGDEDTSTNTFNGEFICYEGSDSEAHWKLYGGTDGYCESVASGVWNIGLSSYDYTSIYGNDGCCGDDVAGIAEIDYVEEITVPTNMCGLGDSGLKCDEDSAKRYCLALGFDDYIANSKTCTPVHADYMYGSWASQGLTGGCSDSGVSSWILTMSCNSTIIETSTNSDYSWFDSTSSYLCMDDYDSTNDKIGGSEWRWWDAAGAGNSYKIHTIIV